MTPEQELLRRVAWVAAEIARTVVGTTGAHPDIYFAKGSGDLLYRLRLQSIGNWMNSGEHKDYLFNMIRLSAEAGGYDCVIISTEAWAMKPSQKFLDITTHEAQLELAKRGVSWLAENGYGERAETMIVTGQTAEHFTVVSLPFDRDTDGTITAIHGPTRPAEALPQGNFMGRQKMFGPQDPDMAEMYAFLKSHGLSDKLGSALNTSAQLINIATETTV